MTSEICRECGESTDKPVAVALNHVGSTGGQIVYVCPTCRYALGLIPLDQHPPGSLGFPRYEDCIPETERMWGMRPLPPRYGPASAP